MTNTRKPIIAGMTLEDLYVFARRDDCLSALAPSDLRQLIGLAMRNTPPKRASEITYKVGRWLSAALEDDAVCQEMKDDIIAWMEAGRPNSHTSPEREALVRCMEALKAIHEFPITHVTENQDATNMSLIAGEAITQAKQALEEGDQ